VEFATKPALGTAMITGAAGAGVPFAWVAAGEVYGRGRKLVETCEQEKKGYVVAVPVNFQVRLSSGRKATVAGAGWLRFGELRHDGWPIAVTVLASWSGVVAEGQRVTSIERTAYPQFRRLTTARVLHVFFSPD
jgi:hypothetical protein